MRYEEEAYPRRAAMFAELIDRIESASLINKILFSDEATFHTCGKVIRHNCRISADEKPPNFLKRERDTPKVNVLLGMIQSKVMDLSSLQRLRLQDLCILTCLNDSSNLNFLHMAFLTQ